MAYEIPQNLKYQEKIAFNLTFMQMVWLGLFGGSGAIIIFKTLLIFELKVGIALSLVGIGVGFAFFNLFEHLKSAFEFVTSFRKAGYLDSQMEKFVELRKVENNTIYLDKKRLVGIIQVNPVNFSILSPEQQEAIIGSFRDFLNSIDFPIQIVMRTVDLNLDEYLNSLRKRVLSTKKEALLGQFNNFEEFMHEHTNNKAIKNRLFYIIIPCEINNGEEFALDELSNRIEQCQAKLKKCNLLTKRLDSNELTSLLASFFEGFVEEGHDYFSPITTLEKFEGEK